MAATQNIGMAKGYDVTDAVSAMCFVKLVADADQTVEMCDTAGELMYGVTMFSVSDSEILRGKGASVILEGRAIVITGVGGLSEGDIVTTDANGHAVVATAGDVIAGICDEGGAAGEQATVKLAISGAQAS